MDRTKEIIRFTQLIGAALATYATWLFGGWDIALTIFVILMVLDYATGVIASNISGTTNSNKGFKGILRKTLMLIVLAVGALVDRLLNTGAWTFRTLVAYFYISNEGISILENIGKSGVELPTGLQKALEQLKGDGEK